MRLKNDWPTLLILLVSLFVTFYTANYIYSRELRGSLMQLEADVEKYAAHITTETERSLTLLATLKSFLSVNDIQRETFHSIADDALKRYQQLQGIVWVPYVAHSQREALEKSQQQFIPGFEFRQRSGAKLVRAPDNDFYLPVYYQRTQNDDTVGYGLDLGTSAMASSLKELEGASNEHFIVDMLPAYGKVLSGEVEAEHYLTVVMPVYKHAQPSRENFKGFLIGAVQVESLLLDFLADPQHKHIDLTIADMSNAERTFILNMVESIDDDQLLEQYEYTTEVDMIGGRRWTFMATPTDHYIELVSPNQWKPAIVIGLLINFLLAGYIYSLRTRNNMVQQQVSERTAELEMANMKLENMSRTDALTQLANRRYFDEYLKREWLRARRQQSNLTLILCDVDYFKNFNDHYGHVEGDLCLQKVALILRGCFNRSTDLVARYGGEEFAMILPETALSSTALLERCRDAIQRGEIAHGSSQVADVVTISLGACTVVPNDAFEMGDLIKVADEALYQAKSQGRNCGVLLDFIRDSQQACAEGVSAN